MEEVSEIIRVNSRQKSRQNNTQLSSLWFRLQSLWIWFEIVFPDRLGFIEYTGNFQPIIQI